MPLHIVRASLEPLAGIVFTGLWLSSEVERQNGAVAVAFVIGLAIALSRVAPRIAMGIVALMLIGQVLVIIPLPGPTNWAAYFGIAIVVGLAATSSNATVRWIALGFGAVAAVAAVALMVFQGNGYEGWLSWIGWGHIRLTDILAQFAFLALAGIVTTSLAWGSGFAISATRRLMQTQQVAVRATRRLAQSEVELAVAQERNRIAQEMHDVLAHSLAVVVAQADGARYLRPSRPAAVDGALKAIADSARLALGDMRGVIDGILDGTELPQPRLTDLEPLVAGMASTGMTVVLRETGDRGELGEGQELALYRIVQEGLTNALRHRGRGCEVRIVLDWRGPGVSLLFESSGGEVTTGAFGLAEQDSESREGGSETAESEDAESEDAASEDARSEDAGSEDAGSEDAGSEDARSEDAGSDRAESKKAESREADSRKGRSRENASQDFPAPDGLRTVRVGRGVIGMRERAHVAGGWLTVGLEEDGTHRLTAFLPYYADRDPSRRSAPHGPLAKLNS